MAEKNEILDVVILALLYTFLIFAGGEAVQIDISNWLIAFSIMLFFSLACLKRFSDGKIIAQSLKERGYQIQDLPVLQGMGICAGMLSVLVLTLYIDSDAALISYKNSAVLWGIHLILLCWIGMMWLRASRGLINIDPVLCALKD